MNNIPAFEFATANRIIFGAGKIDQMPEIAASFGKRALLVTAGKSTEAAADHLANLLRQKQIETVRINVNGEPDVKTVESGVETAQASGCDQVISLGGGSVIDTGKAIAGLLTNGGALLDYVEVIGRGQTFSKPAAPFIAIPTTAGTGSEVTRNAVISFEEPKLKVSLRSPYMLPRVALVDPELTYTMPQPVTASTGLDALTQLIEPYTSSRHNPLTDMIAQAGLVRVRSLRAAYLDPNDKQAREDMAFASLCGGLALANSGLGAVHGFAAVLGARFAIPHGVCCAALLPYTLKGNVDALLRRAPASPFLDRYRIVAQLLTGKNGADALTTIDNMLQLIASLCNEMKIPNISEFGVTEDLFPSIVEQAQKASSMKANPIKLTDEELTGILKEAL